MPFKDSASRTLPLIKGILFMLLLSVGTSHAQIIGGETQPDKKKEEQKEKKIKNKNEFADQDSLTGTTYYLTGLYTYSYRSFQDNSPFGVYETWNDQRPDQSGGASIGLILPLNNWFSVDFGFTFFGQKEQYFYAHPTNDSTFFFSNNYMHIGIPIRMRFSYGDKFEVFGYAGVMPVNLINIRYKEFYERADGADVDNEVEVVKNNLSIFNVMGIAGLGMTYNFDQVGFTLYPEYRHSFMQTYDQSRPIEHKMYGLGIHAGLTLRF